MSKSGIKSTDNVRQSNLFENTGKSARSLKEQPSAVVKTVLGNLKNPREREVLIWRYSLDGGGKRILEEIGQRYNVTRERVRQIERSALVRLQKDQSSIVDPIHVAVESHLKRAGGISRKHGVLMALLGERASDPIEHSSLEFIIRLHPRVIFYKDDELMHESLLLENVSISTVFKLIRELVNYLEEAKAVVHSDQLLEYARNYLSKIESNFELSDQALINILEVSIPIIQTESGHWGLASWREINPRSIRDKTFYILNKHGKPMHFTGITDEIRKLDFDKRSVTTQAVHNELIRDERFVLIGRGIYALKSWGYEEGTVKDVLVNILKERQQPLHKDEIIEEVMKRRQVKHTTVILNLQDKNLFERVAKATYALKGE